MYHRRKRRLHGGRIERFQVAALLLLLREQPTHAILVARGAHRCRRIVRQAERLNTLIDQLLDVSRLERGQFAIEADARFRGGANRCRHGRMKTIKGLSCNPFEACAVCDCSSQARPHRQT